MHIILQVEKELSEITFLFKSKAVVKAFIELSRDVSIVFDLWNGMKYSANCIFRISRRWWIRNLTCRHL